MTALLDRRIDKAIATGLRVGGWVTRHNFGNDSKVAALLSTRNVIGIPTRQSGAAYLGRYYLTEAATVGLWIVREPTALELRWKWSARYSSGNDTVAAALLVLRNVVSLSTRQSCTRNLDGYNLTIATSVGLRIVVKATTSKRRREWIARYRFGKDLIIATLLGMRNVEGLSTRQSDTKCSKGYNLVEAAFMGLGIIR